MSSSELNETERISKASNIANSLANATSSTETPIFAADIDLAVNIVPTLNKYDCTSCDKFIYYLHYSVTETVVTNLTANDTFFEVRSN